MNNYEVIFGGTNLATLPNTELYNHDFNQLPDRQINIYKIARADLSIVTSSEYSQKDITVWLEVCGASRAGTEASLATLKSVLQPQNQTLRVSNGGVVMQYIATMNGFKVTDWDGITAQVEITFIASTPIGTAVTPLTLLSDTINDTTEVFNITINGSFNARPLITIQYGTITGGTAKSVTVQDNQTSQGITINGNFATGDIVEIDSTNFIVRHNGVSVDFDGLFPYWNPGSRQLLYNDTFTTRAGTITGSYNPRYA